MRPIYFLLNFTLNYAIRIFYPRNDSNNAPKEFYGSTIYVSNHAASFMDPLVVAVLRRPIVFFMTRSDVFTPATRWFLWACQMLPIYRQLDGEDTKGKNEAVFKTCTKILSRGRNLLIFGEGFTDDVFIRRLKPVKKGAVRIGFLALESLDWKKKIYLAAVGCNYSNPNTMRSDILISYSDKICLNDYREAYEENPNKVIADLTKVIQQLMQDQITHVEKKEEAPFHENIMRITRKGMNAVDFDRSIPLKKRWNYSRSLANWLNTQDVAESKPLSSLKKSLEDYFALLKRFRIEDRLLVWKSSTARPNRNKEIFLLIVLFPTMLLGVLHCALPYILVKRFAEKKFKRKVFWSSVKMVVGKIAIGLFNIPAIFLFYHFIYPSYWLGFAYYVLIGLFGLSAYMWTYYLMEFKKKGVIRKTDLGKFVKKRQELVKELRKAIPAEFH